MEIGAICLSCVLQPYLCLVLDLSPPSYNGLLLGRQTVILDRFDRNQLHHRIPCFPLVRHLSLPKPNNTLGAIFQMVSNSLLQIVQTFSRILGVCLIIFLLGLTINPISSTIRDTSNSIGSADSYGPSSRNIRTQPGPVAEPFTALGPHKTGSPLCHSVNGLGEYSHWDIPVEHDVSETWRDYQAQCFLLRARKFEMQ